MLHILTEERLAPASFAPEERRPGNLAPDDPDNYELLLGTRQVAGLSLVVLLLISLLAGASYLAGRASVAKKGAATKDAEQRTTAPKLPLAAAAPAASLVDPSAPSPANKNSAPLFAEPVKGGIYIQAGAVDRGMAAIIAEGLRAHGFNAFVAAGPNNNIYRVLMGPFPNPPAYQSAKASLDAIGLSSFEQQYQK